MVRTSSIMLPLGTICPEFDLEMVQDVTLDNRNPYNSYERFCNADLPNKPLFLMVVCAHCPFVKHVESCISNLYLKYGQRVQFLAVSSNSLITHPQDAPQHLAEQANRLGWRFPYLFDKNHKLAKALKAACTPDFYIFSPVQSGDHILRYRGQLDDSRPGNDIPVTGKDIQFAIDSLLNDETISIDQKPSIGCNIKWNPGEEPSWFG